MIHSARSSEFLRIQRHSLKFLRSCFASVLSSSVARLTTGHEPLTIPKQHSKSNDPRPLQRCPKAPQRRRRKPVKTLGFCPKKSKNSKAPRYDIVRSEIQRLTATQTVRFINTENKSKLPQERSPATTATGPATDHPVSVL